MRDIIYGRGEIVNDISKHIKKLVISGETVFDLNDTDWEMTYLSYYPTTSCIGKEIKRLEIVLRRD